MCWWQRTVYVYRCGHMVPMDDTHLVSCGRRGCRSVAHQVVDHPIPLGYYCSGCNPPR